MVLQHKLHSDWLRLRGEHVLNLIDISPKEWVGLLQEQCKYLITRQILTHKMLRNTQQWQKHVFETHRQNCPQVTFSQLRKTEHHPTAKGIDTLFPFSFNGCGPSTLILQWILKKYNLHPMAEKGLTVLPSFIWGAFLSFAGHFLAHFTRFGVTFPSEGSIFFPCSETNFCLNKCF